MNAALYGFGPPRPRKWILVDCGIGFASEEGLPGVDLMFPDTRFIEGERQNLLGIFITHAHEDHIGALAELWPRLRVPVYATRFALGLLEARRLGEPGAPKVELREIAPGQRIAVGPFDGRVRAGRPFDPGIERARDPHPARARRPYRRLEARRHAFRRQHRPRRRCSGGSATRASWRSSATRRTSCARDAARARARSPSGSPRLIAAMRRQRVAVTTFASNVARIRAVALAAARPAAARSSWSGAPWTG